MDCKAGYKTCVIFLALLQLIVAVSLMIAGIFVFSSFGNLKNFAEDTYTLVPASVLIAAGVLLIILGIFGICGACKESKCMLSIFFALSGAIFIIEMVGACLALAMRETFETTVQNEFGKLMDAYNSTQSARDEVDWIQIELHCCGAVNVTDWDQRHLNVPDSCCKFNSTIPAGNCTQQIILENNIPPCGKKFHDEFFSNLNVIGGVGLAFALIQLFALVSVLALLCRRQEHYDVF